MPFSRDLRNGPRNHFVDALASEFTHVGDTLRGVTRELAGRTNLLAGDIAETEIMVARGHAALDRISATLIYSRPALVASGADNGFMGRFAEAERTAAATGEAQS